MSKLKQAFYENHSGSSIWEINRITAILIVGHLLYCSLYNRGFIVSKTDQFAWGFACYVFNNLLAMTVYSKRHLDLLLIYGTPMAILLLWQYLKPVKLPERKSPGPQGDAKIVSKPMGKRMKNPYLSVYRATMMITTVLAILAVDLPIFPRRYAKSETWGTSLMDLGVGSFVFSSGLVSSTQHHGMMQGFKQGGIILGMGVARALMVRGTGYHEHVSEYGTHWNFFITLSLLPPLLPIFRRVQRLGLPFLIQGFIVCAFYQTCLLQTKWQAWIISAPRLSFVSANKEGLSSFVGYMAIYLFGLDSGGLVLSRKPRPILLLLLISCIIYMSGFFFSNSYLNLRVSRRLANAPYIMWIAAHNTTFLFMLAMVDRTLGGSGGLRVHEAGHAPTSRICLLLEKLNAHGLYAFLGANLLTGGINLLMGDAMMTTDTPAGLAIMISYALVISLSSYLA